MKYHLLHLSALLFSFGNSVFAQERSSVPVSPFTFEAAYVGDGLADFSGGIREGATYLGTANLRFSFDTQKSGLWKGGLFYVDAANTHGGTPSADLIGDFQIASNIEAGNMTYVHELWFSQRFGKFSTILGVQDLNAQFASSDLAGLFLNSSFGVHSTISNNIPSPIYPLTALGWQIQYDFSDRLMGQVALFDGLPEGFKHNTHNLSWKLDPDEGFLVVSEFSYKNLISENNPGTLKLGAYYHNHYDFNNSSSVKNHENYGLYIVADQTVFKNRDGSELSLFTQASVSPRSINTNCNYFGLGLNYAGLFNSRPEDVLGIGAARAGFQNSVYSSETTIELTYQASLTSHLFIQPDLQYVIHPAGTESKLKNAMVGIFRVGLHF